MDPKKKEMLKLRNSMRIASAKAEQLHGSVEFLAASLMEAEGFTLNDKTNELIKDGKVVGHYGGVARDDLGYFVQIQLTEAMPEKKKENVVKLSDKLTPVEIRQESVAFIMNAPAPHPIKTDPPKITKFEADGFTVDMNTGEVDLKKGEVSENARAFWNHLKILAENDN